MATSESTPQTEPGRRLRKPRRSSGQENYIPLRKTDLRKALLADPILTASQRGDLEQFCRLLEAAIHYDYHELLDNLKDSYAPFDPDVETHGAASHSTQQREQLADHFFDAFIDLVDRANFQHLSHEQLVEALDQASAFGIQLDVDFKVFQRLEIFARGSRTVTRALPGFWNQRRGRKIDVEVFRRLILLFRLQANKRVSQPVDTNIIYIKIFKDVPKSDLDMLLPGTRVKISWFDQSKIILPTLSGVALAMHKIVTGGALLLFAGFYGVLTLLGLVGGTIGYGIRSFFAYSNAKDKYQLSLTRSLYFQNLDSNAGVTHRLLDEAEEQEFREAILAYFLLWKNAGREGWTIEQLDLAAEQLLLELCGLQIDFEIGDALDKLIAMKLIVPAAGGRWRALQLEEALTVLDATWDGIFHADDQRRGLQVPHFFRNSSPDYPADSDDWGPVL